ncbi:MAG: arylsulfatase [Anaerolineae bacterium]|nr:arylsulfatase [Anaerolineae bacterium]
MERKPNVVLIIMDDLAYGDLACHGNPYTRTPHLDHLYAESARLTRYCSGPLCTPARASLMTGRYHLRTRAIDTYLGRAMLDPDETTLAQVLQDAGYTTGIFGKWHLGDCYPMRPQDKGFGEALTHRAGGIGQPGDHPDNYDRESYFDPVLNHNGEDKVYAGYCTDIFTDAAMQFIEAEQHRPFFTYLATNAPHTPLQVADEWVQPYRDMGVNENHARIYGMVENIDWNIGRLLKKLDTLGLAEETIVIYTSDHGPAGNRDSLPEEYIRYNAGLRAGKGTLYEGGVRVPHFWRWTEHIPAGYDVDAVASPIDVLPTLATLCGATVPTDRTIDGVDLSPLLIDDTKREDWPERAIFMQWHRGDTPVRYRNSGTITQQYKWYRPAEDEPDELYDVMADPGEQHDLAGEKPDMVDTLRRRYEVWFDEVSHTRPDNYAAPLIAVGSSHEPQTILTRNDWRIHGEDGWGDEHYGSWRLEAVEAGHYTFAVRFSQPVSGSVSLKLDGSLYERNTSARFSNLVLNRGPHRVEAWSQMADGTRLSALYVLVHREQTGG